jgi:hypothetical protein
LSLSERLTPVAQRLSRLRGSIRRLYALDGLSRLVLAFFAFVVVTFMADWALLLPAAVRLVLLVGGVGVFGWILVKRVLYPLGVRISDDDLALFVEREFPELNDRLISAIQLVREPLDLRPTKLEGGHVVAYNSPELVEALVADAEQVTAGIDFGRVLVRKHVAKYAGWAAVFAIALSVGAAVNPKEYASIYLNRILGGSRKWPQRTHLRVLDFVDGRRVWARGDDLTIAVEYAGVKPSKVTLSYQYVSGESGKERMTPLAGDRFQFTFTRLAGPFTFTVEGGDDVTDVHTVDTVTPPTIDTVRLFYEYPAYMRKQNTPPDRPETSGNVVAPFGTKVRIEAESNEDLKSASLAIGPKGKEKVAELEVARTAEGKPRRLSGGFVVNEASGEYALQLLAENGLPNRDPIRFAIKGLPDREPEILVLDPLSDEPITEVCERPLAIDVKDDHGISRIVLRTVVAKQQQRTESSAEFTRKENSRDYGETQIHSETTLDVSAFGLQAGDHVEIQFQAEDYKDVGGRNVRNSKVYKFSVVSMGTLEKELQDAIEKIKLLLKSQHARQETMWNRTGRLNANFGKLDQLAPEQQGEVRQSGLEQNDITSKLDSARKDILQIMRRGVYNKIYNETAADNLRRAAEELDFLVGAPGDATRDGLSRVATARLDQAAKLRNAAERTQAFRDAQDLQSRVATGIKRALDYLDKWSSYQEVIRIAREIKEQQDNANKEIRKIGGGK